MISQFLDALSENKEYDFISNNYTNMSKFELRSIILEYIYAVHYSSEHPHETLSLEEDIREQVQGELESEKVFG